MRWLSRLTTVLVVGAAATALVLGVLRLARPARVGGGFRTSALFRDAAGLPIGSRVVIAGVTVGQIERLTVDGSQARVAMRLRDGTILCDDAWATKKAASALGDSYVELSPGEADPAQPTGCLPPHRRLVSGEPVPRVVEAASTDRVLRGVEHAMPRMDEALGAAEAFIDEGRQWVAGPFAESLAEIDRDLAEGAAERALRDVSDGVDRLDRWTAEAATGVADVAPTANRRLDELAGDVSGFTDDMRTARADLTDALAGARARIDEVDPYLDDADDVIAALAGRDGEPPGRLARLIDDPELADDLTDVTEGAAAFTATLERLKTTLGFRMEVNLLAVQPNFFISAEIGATADTFYLVEAEKGQWGDVPAPRLTDASGSPVWTRDTLIRERIRFTAQWGKRFGPIALRAGLKESMLGVGVDAVLAGGRLRLASDVMEASFARRPRVKLAAAMALYRTLYVVGGIDDILVDGARLPIQPWPPDADVPIQFEELRYGRDFFLGLELRFTDADINRMLLLYGGLLGMVLSG